jgi:hypothetical protein
MSMAELFLKMFATRRADGIRPTRDETRLSVCARLRVKVSGFGKDPTRLVMDMPRIYNSRLSKRPFLRAQTIVCGEMYMKYMHMRCTYTVVTAMDGLIGIGTDRALCTRGRRKVNYCYNSSSHGRWLSFCRRRSYCCINS